jgi:NTP pyrophosphatase (non-canonical NTP hydrolase)
MSNSQDEKVKDASFQEQVAPWVQACFGAEIASNVRERNHRFIEESLELVQAQGCSKEDVLKMVDYVYDRPVGDPPQEVGGVMVTLACLCLAADMDMHDAGEVELARIWTKIEQIRKKQQTKPQHSPLPIPQDLK